MGIYNREVEVQPEHCSAFNFGVKGNPLSHLAYDRRLPLGQISGISAVGFDEIFGRMGLGRPLSITWPERDVTIQKSFLGFEEGCRHSCERTIRPNECQQVQMTMCLEIGGARFRFGIYQSRMHGKMRASRRREENQT